MTDNATDTPRRRRRDVTVTAPSDMSAFAVVSGDHNPIHTDRAAALLAGLESPIVHGMWLSAAAQHVVTATDGKAVPPARLVGWTARFLGMVLPGDEVDFRVDRVGIDRGAEIVEVTARVGSDLVMSATAQLAAPKTVYAFPGQGIQSKGMGMDVRARSKAARKVWDTADKFTRDTLGFSVLHVVRDNPTSLIASGVHYQHPEGVLYLTQFTQVAMATVAAAQVAEMREQGAFVEGAIACGHSVGEYTALACVSAASTNSRRCSRWCSTAARKMHDIVPRDEHGRSNYRLAAIRPSQIDLDDADVVDFVAEIAERTGEFLQIVNFNLRGSQYAIAGTVRGLEVLEEEVEKRREISGGKRSFILVPGIDVPFHSSVLRVGVADFRRSLERVMPRDADPELLVGQVHPEPGAAAVHPGPRLHPGDPRSGARRAARRDPRRLRHLAQREADRAVPQGRHRAAGLAVRQPGALDRDAGPALHRGGRRRSRCRAVRRDRREVRADRRRAWPPTRSSCPSTRTARPKCSTPSATPRCCSRPTPIRSPSTRRRGRRRRPPQAAAEPAAAAAAAPAPPRRGARGRLRDPTTSRSTRPTRRWR